MVFQIKQQFLLGQILALLLDSSIQVHPQPLFYQLCVSLKMLSQNSGKIFCLGVVIAIKKMHQWLIKKILL